MIRGLTIFLRGLRSRPRHERQILGLTVYIAATALISVLWLSSLGQSFNLTPSDEKAAEVKNSPDKQETQMPDNKTTSVQEQITPLEALKQAAVAAMTGFKELSGQINRLRQGSAPERPADAGLAAPKDQTQTDIESKPAALNQTKTSGRNTDTSPAKILNNQIQPKTYFSYAAARLIQPLPATALDREKATNYSVKIKSVLYYNLGEIRQTAADFFKYLAQ